MELALYGTGGYFTGPTLRSQKSGDFLTSPEVSPLFGQTLADFVASEYQRVGDPFIVVDAGAGSGSLLRPMLESLNVDAWAIEVSPPARAALDRILGPGRVVGDLDQLPDPTRGVIIANELIDNLPMALAQLSPAGWRERWVAIDGDGLAFVDAALRPEVSTWLDRFSGPVDPGGWVEVQLPAQAWLEKALSRLATGSVVVIDYGDTSEDLAPRRASGTLRTYRSHHLGPHPLDEPGATDITADVNFSALVAVAEAAAADVELNRQDDFLAVWGLREQLSQYRLLELELARTGPAPDRLRARTRRIEAETLLHPRGLGDFRVLVARAANRG